MTDVGSLLLYIAIFSLSGLSVWFYEGYKGIGRSVFLFLAIIMPTILAACRVDVGTDYDSYEYLIKWAMSNNFSVVLNNNTSIEIGFRILIKLLSYTNNLRFVFGTLACIPLCLVMHTLKNQYQHVSLSVAYTFYLFMYFASSFNITRQCIALALVFWGMKYVFSNKFVKYIAVVLIAASIHRSAFIALIIWVLWDHSNNTIIDKHKLSIISVVSSVVFLLWMPVLRLVIRFVPVFSKFSYLLREHTGQNMDFYYKILLMVLFILLRPYYKNKDSKLPLFAYMLYWCVVMGYSGFYVTYLKRLALYFEYPMIVLFGSLSICFESKNRKFINWAVYLFGLSYFTLSAFVLKQAGLIPYQWRL